MSTPKYLTLVTVVTTSRTWPCSIYSVLKGVLEVVTCMERCGAVVKRRTRDREVPGSIPTNSKCCFLEQETLSTLLSTGFLGKKRATWKISTRLLNVLPSINKVDYYYYYLYDLALGRVKFHIPLRFPCLK